METHHWENLSQFPGRPTTGWIIGHLDLSSTTNTCALGHRVRIKASMAVHEGILFWQIDNKVAINISK